MPLRIAVSRIQLHVGVKVLIVLRPDVRSSLDQINSNQIRPEHFLQILDA
jgi:hypothetical protein